MATQVNGTPLFTIEQIELIRRLRNSGLTKEQLVQAYDAMERLERELGPVYSLPVSLAFQHAALQRQNMLSATAANNAAVVAAAMAAAAQAQQTHQQQLLLQQQQQQAVSTSESPVQLAVPAQGLSSAQGTPDVSPPQIQFQQTPVQLKFPPSDVSVEHLDINIPIPNGIGITDIADDETLNKQFKEFISQGDVACCEEIRQFVVTHSIKQQQIATLAGVSQSYVSRFLKGDYYDMSERSRRAIQKWFVVYRNYPAAIAPAVKAVLLANGGTPKKLPVDVVMSPNGEYVHYPKRERFVFRPNHLEILERYFNEDNYPSHEKREQMAIECNQATERMAGRELTERETVSAQIVSNWFANKRKELKKLVREEGLDVSQVPLRMLGHPSRLLSDFASLVESSNRQPFNVNDARIAGAEAESENSQVAMETQAMVAQENTENQPMEMITTTMTTQDVKPALANVAVENGNAASGSTNGTETPSNGGGDLLSLEQEDEEALSMSVELAAVNQAILSLTGTQPINIKAAEKLVAVSAAAETKQEAS